jgi:tRNA threonylcarbamoyladenosine biosynthesis protein TsaE
VTSRSEAQTAEVAETLATGFRGGEVVLLSGELGAGKTAFVRGLARGLGTPRKWRPHLRPAHGLPRRLAPRPIFTAWGDGTSGSRARGAAGPEVLAVEWAERLRDVPWSAPLRVRLDHAGDDSRIIVIEDAA